jgi:hypothetical protein
MSCMIRAVTCTIAYILTANASSSPSRTQPQRPINDRPGSSKHSGHPFTRCQEAGENPLFTRFVSSG